MISVLLMIFTGICNACMDVLRVRWKTSIFRFWKNQNWINPALSWHNKWKNGDQTQREKFFGSSTFFVWLTDFWHFCKFLMLIFITSAIIFYNPMFKWWIDFIILYCAFTITFEIFFSKILISSKNI